MFSLQKANDNKILGSSVRKIGTGISLIIAIVSVLYTLFLTNILDTGFWDKVLEISYYQTLEDYPERLKWNESSEFIEQSKPYVGYFTLSSNYFRYNFIRVYLQCYFSIIYKTKKAALIFDEKWIFP